MRLTDPQPSADPARLAFPRTLYRPVEERDACGTGFVASIAGERRHGILRMGVEAVINLTHRGAVSADGKTGDGAGVLTQIPHDLFRRELLGMGVRLERDADLGVGMIFFPQAPERQRLCRTIIEGTLTRHGIHQFGWRPVPIDPGALGAKALTTLPRMEQVLMGGPPGVDDEGYERALYLARKEIEEQVRGEGIKDFYIPSFSHRTVIYKGLFVAPQLPRFYRDLADPLYTTALAVFHQRYSTNTFPTWFLAQPFRMLGHNGEINTLQGNQNWMYAREKELQSRVWGARVDRLRPLLAPGGSDSAHLDNVLEALVLSGRDVRHAFMMLIPEAWENMPQMDPALKAFYEYHACLSEPWDGPAAIAFTDGRIVGATLDRNGLRPARYKVTADGIVVMASEVGVVDLDDAVIIEKGRLGPGKMIAVDTTRGLLLHDDEIKREMATRRPYREWVGKQIVRLTPPRPRPLAVPGERAALTRLQRTFGYTAEEISLVLTPMFSEMKEPVGSMGDDTPLAVLSRRPRLLYSYFKQKFAQVTNPPIDPLREQIVMSLSTYVGNRGSLLEETPESARLIHLESPILYDHELEAMRRMEDPLFASGALSTCFAVGDGPAGLERALRRLTEEASRAVDEGKAVLILSDRGVDPDHAPMPMLLAVGAVVHHLIKKGKGMRADVVVETGEAWEHHHFATLIGYGAAAVNPYLALQTVAAVAAEKHEGNSTAVEKALGNYKTALDKGILKIMSKMGISALASYQGAQIFEAIGLSEAVVERCFVGTPSKVSGIGIREIAEESLARHRDAFGVAGAEALPNSGFYTYRASGEQHAFNPPMVKALHAAVRGGDYAQYRKYAELVNEREPLALRDLLRFRPGKPIPLEEVEPAEEIAKRFSTQAMSIGALGPEAHKTLAIAMNRLGAKSNTGEGGEDPAWFHPLSNGDTANSKIKQVASARFGVTPEYLVRAEQLEIKMAQGSKPGEGGQLPGHKVAPHIARIRRAVPGIPLISPAPHHDIYSIEDLSQLIYDLKMVNPRAKVGVKLVAEAGVGTIAAGVAKAYADVILISGHDGGTGASPLSSIKNAGAPWELGLSETQQVLVLNDLRGRVTLRVDGGMKTGRHVVIAAMLGAEEFGFGSAAVAAIGCVMTRQCHLNTCPVGIATQKPELRARFKGQPEQAIWFFLHVAQEVREILASLGFRKLEEVVGRTELLEQILPTNHPKARTVDLQAVLGDPDPDGTRPRRCIQPRNDRGDVPLDDTLVTDAAPALERGEPVRLAYPIRNIHRTVGARLAGAIADRYGDAGLPDGTITLEFTGSAGQSFGAFLVKGMSVRLTGEANDYVGKGMGGGELVLCPPAGARFTAHENVIMGNTCLYGATGGFLFAAGRAGERFAVRNSGCTAVVEGVGDHGCEYMTAGCVVILGETGRNFGAGMTNGEAYVLDEAGGFPERYNPELVTIGRVTDPEDAGRLRHLVERHQRATGSARAAELLARWDEVLPRFWKVAPKPPEGLREPPPRAEAVAAEPATVGAR